MFENKKEEKEQQPDGLMGIPGSHQSTYRLRTEDDSSFEADVARGAITDADAKAIRDGNYKKYWTQSLLSPERCFEDDAQLLVYLANFIMSGEIFPSFSKGSGMLGLAKSSQKKNELSLLAEGNREGLTISQDHPLDLRYHFQGQLIGCSDWIIKGSAVATIAPGDDDNQAKVVYAERRLDPYFIFLMALIGEVKNEELIARFNSTQVASIITAVEQLQQAQHPLYASTVEGLHRRADALRPAVEGKLAEEKQTADNSPDSLLTLFKTPPYMQTLRLDGAKFIESNNSFIQGRIEDLAKQSGVGNQDGAQNDQKQASTDEGRGLTLEVVEFLRRGKLQWDQTYFSLSHILIRKFIDESLRYYQERLILYYAPPHLSSPNEEMIFLEKNPENSLNSEMNGDEIRLTVPVAPYTQADSKQTLFPNTIFTRYICLEGNRRKLNPTKATIDVHDLFFRVLMSTPAEKQEGEALQTKFSEPQWQAVAKALAPLMHTVEMGVFDVQTAFEKADLLRPALEESTVFFGLGPEQQTQLLGILLSDAFSSLDKGQQTRLLGILLSDAFSPLDKDQQTRLLSAALSSQKIMEMLTKKRLQRIKESLNGPHPHRHQVPIILALVLSTLSVTGTTLIAVWPTIDSLLNISDSVVKALSLQDCAHITIGQCTLFPAYIVLAAGLLYGIQTLCHDSKTGQIAKAMKYAQVALSAN